MKKNLLRAILSICLVIFCSVTLAACGDKPETPPPAPVAKAETTADGLKYVGINSNTAYKCVGFAEGGEKAALVIPDTVDGVPVTEVADEAFVSKSSNGYVSVITSVSIGNNVTTIGKEAFSKLWICESVHFGKSVKTLGVEAFSQALKLKTITVDSANPYFYTDSGNQFLIAKEADVLIDEAETDDYAEPVYARNVEDVVVLGGFGQGNTINIPNGVKAIGEYAFYGSIKVKSDDSARWSLTIPASVKYIGAEAFYKCSAINSMTLNEGLEIIGDGAFQTEAKDDYAKDGNKVIVPILESITIPASVKQIYTDAFRNQKQLAITFASGSILEDIGRHAFDATKIASFTAPSTLKTIRNGAFYNCDSLTSVTLNEGLTTIQNEAFAYADALEEITIPKTVTSLGDNICFATVNDVTINIYKYVKNADGTFAENTYAKTTPAAGDEYYNFSLKQTKNGIKLHIVNIIDNTSDLPAEE